MGVFGQSEFVSIENLSFRIYTDEEIGKISVMRITNPESFNNLGHIASNGLYDLRLGPVDSNDDVCTTCRLRSFHCAGHCGHIEIPLPIYNPVFYDTLKKIISHVCLYCHKFLAKKEKILQLDYQRKLLKKGFIAEALELDDFVSQVVACAKSIEAEEGSVGVDDKSSKKSKKAVSSMFHILPTKLESYLKNVINKSTPQDIVTSNLNAVWQEIEKKFWDDHKISKTCPFCDKILLKLTLQGSRFMKKNVASKKKGEDEEDFLVDTQSFLTPKQIQQALRACWVNDEMVLSNLYPILAATKIDNPTDIFFVSNLLVIPPKFRPYSKLMDGLITEHESSPILKNVIKLSMYLVPLISVMNGTLKDLPVTLKQFYKEITGNTTEEKCVNMWHQVQSNVDNLFDSNLNSSKQVTSKGIRQVIEKKNGLMRHNLMGKRVNFSARSVAAPDPHLAVDEVGIPMDFATKLTYPVPVTDWNIEEMRKIVMNGPDKYPGALLVEDEEGKKVRLLKLDETQRSALANKLLTPIGSNVKKVNAHKIVHRQLKNGDYVLMNRQPTLHRPSIQAHRVRVTTKDRVLRMPYANCKAYNADFDGDEFNMHFPQNELARSEAKHLIMTHNQYLTPKDGSPLAGLIQDCVVSSVKITTRGKFFTREDYHQLVYASLPDHVGKIVCLPPCIMKPKQLWSGKQVISTLMYNIIPSHKAKPSFTFKTSVKADIWQTGIARPWRGGGEPETKREALTESKFVMRDGELLCGVIDKSAIGSTSHGLIHTCYDLYGGCVSYKLLTAINRLCVYYLTWVGHTITVKDFLTPIHVSKTRREALNDLIEIAPCEVKSKLDILEGDFRDYFESAHMSRNDKNMAVIDAAYTSALGPTTSRVTSENEKRLLRPNLDNQMKMMVDTGAKGSKVNMNQMASLFGSVAIDGKRMPLSITGKSLPSFKPYDPNPCSGGYIPNRFMTGINPKSYFFLCIVGRDSLQHTAVKTANSGYVQRCLIKHLEGIRVDYDMTVRNSDGLVLQFSYGEDGLDVTKVPFMSNPSTMDVLVTNYSRLIDDRALTTAQSVGNQEQVQKYLQKFKKKKQSNCTKRQSGFLKFCKRVVSHSEGHCSKTGRSNNSKHLENLWHNLTPDEKSKYNRKVTKYPDPIDSVFSGAANLGVVSEALDTLIDQYYNECYLKRPVAQQNLSREEVERTIHMKALMSKVDPGEAVGALCAQALGEPLTQMTLNTFHFAGKDELNVTLGVPRMIEILRTGSKKISTPIMEVPFYPHVSRQQAEKLRLVLSEVSLNKVMLTMNVVSRLSKQGNKRLHRLTKIKFSFMPYKEYKHVFAVTPSDVLRYVEKYFLIKIVKEIYKSLKRQKIHCAIKQDKKEGRKSKDDSDEIEEEEPQQSVNMEQRVEEAGLSDDSDDSDDEVNDGDADAMKKAKKAKEQDYSDEEEEILLSDSDNEDESRQNEESEAIPEENHKSHRKKSKRAVGDRDASDRIDILKSNCPGVRSYDFDREKQLWCEVEYMLPVADGAYDLVSIVRNLSERSFVSHVNGIRRVFVVEKDDTLMLRTEGVNIMKMYTYEHLLNVNKLYTNNIHQVAEMYGIEAAQRSIIREIRAVQSAYDINVNFRHLSLLADYFTCEGKYKACSRFSLSTCASPIQKMSFETCTQFLKTAILQGEMENMDSPSSNIAVGQPPKVGTNTMHVRHVYNTVCL